MGGNGVVHHPLSRRNRREKNNLVRLQQLEVGSLISNWLVRLLSDGTSPTNRSGGDSTKSQIGWYVLSQDGIQQLKLNCVHVVVSWCGGDVCPLVQ